MRGLFYKLVLSFLIMAVVGPFFLKGQDGQPLMSFSDIKMPSFAPAKESMQDVVANVSAGVGAWSSQSQESGQDDSAPKYYKWQDESGQWHFGSKPGDSVNAEQVWVEVNVVESGLVAATSAKLSTPEPAATGIMATVMRSANALEDARAVQGLIDDRHQRQAQTMDAY